MIEQCVCETGVGRFDRNRDSIFSCLTNTEFEELNTIGYTGKNSAGKKTSRAEFLNSLSKGEWNLTQTKFDNGDFTEKFAVARYHN